MIKNIEKSFLVLESFAEESYIPYHRITRIDYNDQTIFDRPIRPLPKRKN